MTTGAAVLARLDQLSADAEAMLTAPSEAENEALVEQMRELIPDLRDVVEFVGGWAPNRSPRASKHAPRLSHRATYGRGPLRNPGPPKAKKVAVDTH